jgi:putative Mn2+ efflux pump MntP
MIKNIFTGVVYFLAGIASVELMTYGFTLMNKQDTLSFWAGLAVVVTITTFIGMVCYNFISQFIKTKNK